MKRVVRLLLAWIVATAVVLGAAVPAAAHPVLHTVQWGESLWLLARRYGTTVEAIQAANGLWGTEIWAGTRLWIPDGGGIAATEGEIYLLAQLITAEARGEPYLGQVAVGAVVVNRVKSPLFPNSILGVIFQWGEFEPVLNGQIYLPPTASALRAAREAVAGVDPTGGALFFFNPAKTWNAYLWSRPYRVTIGGHRFVA